MSHGDDARLAPEATVILRAPYERADWLERRMSGIGGSEAATVCGFNRWRSAYELWQEKAGIYVPPDDVLTPEESRWWGLALEDDLRDAFTAQTGMSVAASPGMLCHHERSWQSATPDGFALHGETCAGIVEYKTAGLHTAHEWADNEVPMTALIQVQHYMSVTGCTTAWVAGLIAGRFVVHEVPRDEELIGSLIEAEAVFWQHVQEMTPPPVVARDVRAIARQYAQAVPDEGVLLSSTDIDVLRALRETDATIRALVKTRDAYRAQLQLTMGEAEAAFDGERVVATWRNVTSQRLDSTALTADHPDLVAKYTKQSTARRFLLTKGA